jgi:hypothetical protein
LPNFCLVHIGFSESDLKASPFAIRLRTVMMMKSANRAWSFHLRARLNCAVKMGVTGLRVRFLALRNEVREFVFGSSLFKVHSYLVALFPWDSSSLAISNPSALSMLCL